MNRIKVVLHPIIFLLAISALSETVLSFTPDYTPYTPYYPLFDGPENITDMCGTTLGSCVACAKTYQHDCFYYYANGPDDCSKVYETKWEVSNCVMWMFKEKVKDPKRLKETCDLLGGQDERMDSVNWCLYSLVPDYGDSTDDCMSIPDTKNTVDLREECIAKWAENRQEPGECAKVTFSADSEISCCLRATNKDAANAYITTRQDLIDSFMAKYKPEFENCMATAKVTGPVVSEKCEQVNCDCLDPCNKLEDDAEKQRACSVDCGLKYLRCYGEERKLFTPEKNNMYLQQSFFGMFSRKHCPGHSYLPDSQGDKKDFAIAGTVTDTDGHAMPYMQVNLSADGKEFQTLTDSDGKYNISLASIGIEKGADSIPVEITFTLSEYIRGTNYINVWNGPLLSYTRSFDLKTAADTTQDVKLDGTQIGPNDYGSMDVSRFYHLSVIYTHLTEAVDYALNVLKANIDYKLPVDVYVGGNDGTYYSRDDSSIHISATDGVYGSTNKPKNREYHEFSHHILFSQWNGEGIRPANSKNHDGYINPNTADSYTEGFAEFNALAISKYEKDPKPEIYADFGSLENNYKAWSYRGYYEELAIAGILWDLYDDHNDRGDTISIPMSDLWPILKVKRTDFYEYYKALKAAFPDKSKEIDDIFIEHGFFADQNPGNKVRDPEEPYKDLNGNKQYDAGEPFVDYGNIEGLVHPWMQYDDGEVIGKATNYERNNRSQTVRLEDAYLKVADPQVTTYQISVHYDDLSVGSDYEYAADVLDGKIYVNPLPEDVNATITIKPDEKEYTAQSPYVISNRQYIGKYYSITAGQGFYDEHTFGLKAIGAANVNAKKYDSASLTPLTEALAKPQKKQPGSGSDLSMGFLAGAGLIIIGGGLFAIAAVVLIILMIRKKK